MAGGDRVGLAVIGTRTLCFEKPERGIAHAAHLVDKLVQVTGCMDADRSGLDETELSLRVIEHMRPLDPALSAHVHAPRSIASPVARRSCARARLLRGRFAGANARDARCAVTWPRSA